MRQLHVLGVSEDGSTLLLGASKNATKPTHRIPLDDRLRAAARGQMAPFGSDRAESELTPKEMQARLREGASVEEVAKAAGVPVARVLPYFVPVEAERTRIVDEARAARMHRHRGPGATRPLGQAVDTRLQEIAGLKPESVAWTARRRRDGAWVVSVSYAARGRRKAEWLWQPAGREVTPLDPSAARLGSDAVPAPAKRKAAAPKPAAAAPKKSAKKATAKKATAKKASAKKAVATKAAAAKPVARKVAAKPTPRPKVKAAQPVKKAAVAAKAPTRKPVAATPKVAKAAKVATPKPAKATKVAKPRKVVKPRAPRVVPAAAPEVEEGPFYAPAVIKLPVVPVAEPVEEVVEQAAAMVEEQQAEPAAAPARRKGQRVPLPSWSDVLLGVTRDESRRSG